MSRDIKVVIGSNFGDEGKGLMTDYLVSRTNTKHTLVVRFNSGSQAGHTVVTPEGKRHVFGHFGSGAFLGVPSYLSKYFVVNPIIFVNEQNLLKDKIEGDLPKVIIDEECMISTPYDMMINQLVEEYRGEHRHGSCGIGFNETLRREEKQPKTRIRMVDIQNIQDVKEQFFLKKNLEYIRKVYVYERLKELGVKDIPKQYIERFDNEYILQRYIDDVIKMVRSVELGDKSILQEYEHIIFEGAQGLMLDKDYKYFPHVTNSCTGMRNVKKLLQEGFLEKEAIEIIYVTRTYLTRHGAGPFETECKEKPYIFIEDKTNVPNEYQGKLRFGLLDINNLLSNIKSDLRYAEGLNYNVKLAVTCIDQVDSKFKYILNGECKQCSQDQFLQDLTIEKIVEGFYISCGDNRECIIEQTGTN